MPGWQSRSPVAIIGEAGVAHRAMRRGKVVQQHLAAVLLEAAAGGVGDYGEEPGLEAGALLEAIQVAHHGQPGVLHHFIGVALADDGVGHRAHGALVGADEFAESPLLPGQQPG
ncbi:hypothetical protein D9M72_317000 [compost metagenome]